MSWPLAFILAYIFAKVQNDLVNIPADIASQVILVFFFVDAYLMQKKDSEAYLEDFVDQRNLQFDWLTVMADRTNQKRGP